MPASGATPAGAATPQEAAGWVRSMFGRIAPRYDFANHLLSFNADRYWRARAVDAARPALRRPGARVLDLCCGTGDLLIALGVPAFGADFCHPMLTAAARKIARRGLRSHLFESDALALPVRDASLDLITIAFGFRNLVSYDAGLAEFRRALRPGGLLVILEFSQPPNAFFAGLYNFYSRRVLPALGGAVTGAPDAYAYLPDSVRKFPSPEKLARATERAGFRDVRFERLTFGIVTLHAGTA